MGLDEGREENGKDIRGLFDFVSACNLFVILDILIN